MKQGKTQKKSELSSRDKSNKNLVKWKKGQSGNPAGRPKKFTSFLIDSGYKLSEVNDAIQSLLSLTEEELLEVQEDKNATILERTVVNALMRSMKNGSLYSLETLLSRVYGTPKQEIKQDVQIQPPLFPDRKDSDS
jgi:hypothetical protein